MLAISDLFPLLDIITQAFFTRELSTVDLLLLTTKILQECQKYHTLLLGTRVLEVVWYTCLASQKVLEAVELS